MREEHAEYLANRKQEALDAQSLMSDIADRKRKQEENKSDGKKKKKLIKGVGEKEFNIRYTNKQVT